MVGGVRAEPDHARRDRIAALATILFTLLTLAGLALLVTRHGTSPPRASLVVDQGSFATPRVRAQDGPGTPNSNAATSSSPAPGSRGAAAPAGHPASSPGSSTLPVVSPAPTSSAPLPSLPSPKAPPTNPPTATPVSNGTLVFTYFYYWYDTVSGAHLQPDIMHNHFPPSPPPTWRTPEWDQQQLADMSAAGIDVALPVFWGYADGPPDPWSMGGLPVLVTAWHNAQQQGQKPPRLGMFLDTTIVNGRDLTTPDGMAWFYGNLHNYFSLIPRDEWASVGGRPIIFLFTADFTGAFNQATFDYAYSHFQADFGVRPYLVSEISWDYPILGRQNGTPILDRQHPTHTDGRYQWGGAEHGFLNIGTVAEVGPGYDDRGLPGRGSGTYTDRQGGAFYRHNLQAALNSGMRMLAIETWDEMHEASDVCDSVEYGNTYIDITRQYADQLHSRPG